MIEQYFFNVLLSFVMWAVNQSSVPLEGTSKHSKKLSKNITTEKHHFKSKKTSAVQDLLM